MSGFAGVYYLDQKNVSENTLEQFNTALAHRGPDGSNTWHSSAVGFSHLLLKTLPEPNDLKMPLFDKALGLAITGDIRLDNREDIVLSLEPRDRLSSLSDAALLLLCYRKWERQMMKHLVGDFAFVIWDERKKELFCARDHFGIKPFYYYADRDVFVFASEIKALFCIPDIPKKINELMIADYLLWSAEDTEITFFENIHRLPAAHSMTLRPGSRVMTRYWSLDPSAALSPQSDESYAEMYKEIFSKCVLSRARSAYPLGSLLSGGLDSSSIVSVERSFNTRKEKPLHTFSIVFSGHRECDESEYIRSVTSAFQGIREHFVDVTDIPPLKNIDEILRCVEEPPLGNLSIFWAGVFPCVQKNNVRVLLDGEGGDEVVCRGYTRLAELLRNLRWIELWKTLRALSISISRSRRELFWQKALRPNVPDSFIKFWRQCHGRSAPLWFDGTFLNEDFILKHHIRERAEHFLAHEMKPARTVRAEQYSELMSGCNAATFEVMDKLSAPFNIEMRYPFFDKRLVEFCLALPSDQKLDRGMTRVIARRSLKGILPEKIRNRGGKIYMDSHLVSNLKQYEQSNITDAIFKDGALLRSYVDAGQLGMAYEKFMSTGDALSSTSVWQATILSKWLKTHL